MRVEWSGNLSMGVDEIDSQHKSLFKILNDLIEAMEDKKGADEIETVVEFLDSYVIMHFGTEEAYMKKFDYPGYEQHLEQHKVFISSLEGLKMMYEENGVTSALLILLQSKLCNWILNHISQVDKELGVFLIEKGMA